MALGVTDLKKGTLITVEGIPYKITDYAQKQMGRGGSIVNVKLKSLLDGRVLDRTFKGADKVDAADVENRTVQYLYNDGATFFFMDQTSFEQFEVPADVVEDGKNYLLEGADVNLQMFSGNVINVELPKNVNLKVTYTEPAVKGDTTTNIQKDATLETGLQVKVPIFINDGDLVSVDTATGAYRERVKA
ncbi:MAG TPA: elongation factor P [Candidatus Saccharimonadales bacterium]|nr:elongation factor P [Candidatus Saccharimonadales bacterium]